MNIALPRSWGALGLSLGSCTGSPHQLPAIKDTMESPWELVKITFQLLDPKAKGGECGKRRSIYP